MQLLAAAGLVVPQPQCSCLLVLTAVRGKTSGELLIAVASSFEGPAGSTSAKSRRGDEITRHPRPFLHGISHVWALTTDNERRGGVKHRPALCRHVTI